LAELDKLSIVQAVGDELDLSKVETGGTARAETWAFIALNQRVKLELKGKTAKGDDHDSTLWPWPSSYVNQDWLDAGQFEFPVPNSYLKELGHGTELEMHFKAALTLSQVEADAIVGPVKKYRIKAVEDVKPTISSIKDSKGVEIPIASFTVDTSVTLTGTATEGQKVQVLDGTTDKGQAVTDPVTGIWTLTVTGLSVAAHSFTAKAMYGTGQSSEPRTLTVTALVKPTISSIKDSKNIEILPGGSTSDTRVTLTGEASKGQKILLLDNANPLHDAVVDTLTGVWTSTVTGLGEGTHAFIARALYGSEADSEPRKIIVNTFIVEQTPMILSGKKLIPAENYGLQAKEVAGNTGSRIPSGGVPPYTYKSSNPELASVDINGQVNGLKNGTATITITDNDENSASYEVKVSHVYTLLLNNSYMSGQNAIAWLRSVGATTLDLNGNPLGWQIHRLNFVNWEAIYGGATFELGRWVAENTSGREGALFERSAFYPDEGVGSRSPPYNREYRALAYILRN
jgi:hypothetical protein